MGHTLLPFEAGFISTRSIVCFHSKQVLFPLESESVSTRIMACGLPMRMTSTAWKPVVLGPMVLASQAFSPGWEPCVLYGGEARTRGGKVFLRKINARINLVSNFFYIFVL
jgi:hypothetical protein